MKPLILLRKNKAWFIPVIGVASSSLLKVFAKLNDEKSIDDLKRRKVTRSVGYYEHGKVFCFAFVRNPWDLVYTLFQELADKKLSFRDFVLSLKERGVEQQYEILTYRDVMLPEFIGKFENLEADFVTVCKKLGVGKIKLPHLNKTDEKYQLQYDDELKKIVADYFAKDIEVFGFEFEELEPEIKEEPESSLTTKKKTTKSSRKSSTKKKAEDPKEIEEEDVEENEQIDLEE